MNNEETVLEIVKNLRKDSYERAHKSDIVGKEIFIPTRDGKTRALLYKAESKKTKAPVFFDVHGGGFIMGSSDNDDKFCDLVRLNAKFSIIHLLI